MLTSHIVKRIDIISCVLCKDAPCTAACEFIDPGNALRSIWFDNEDVAALKLPEGNPCEGCSAPCEKAGVRVGKVPVKQIMTRLH